MALSKSIADILHPRVRDILSTLQAPSWDSVTRAFILTSRVLMRWHCNDDAGHPEEAIQYFNALYMKLAQGDEKCRRRAKELSALSGSVSEIGYSPS